MADIDPDSAEEQGYGNKLVKEKKEATSAVISWAQATLTALNIGDVKSGSPLHLKLREVMINYREKTMT